MVTSTLAGRQPAASSRRTTAAISSVLATPRGVRPSAGKRLPRSPRAHAPRSAPATAWRATSPSEWPCSRGAPAISTPPSRSPSPGPKGWRSIAKPLRAPSRVGGCAPASLGAIGSPLARMGEDHAPGDRLEDAGHGHVELGIDRLRTTLDDDHRPVVEVADTLTHVLAGLDDADAEVLAGQKGGLDRVRERVDVEDADALEVGDPVEVEIVRQDGPPVALRERDELRVDLGRARDVLVDDLHGRRPGLAHAGQDLEAAPASRPAEGVGAVG